MSLKKECHLKRNVTQNGMSLKTLFKSECHSKRSATQQGMSFKNRKSLKWNVTEK